MKNIKSKITLDIANLKDDVFGKMHYFARSHGDTPVNEAMLQAINEDGNVDMVMRSFGNALARANALMSEFTTVSTEDVTNQVLSSDANISIALTMPSNYKTGMAYSLAQALHQMLVDYAYADWVRVVAPSEEQTALAIVESDVTNLRNAFSRRQRPTRENLTNGSLPFATSVTASATSSTDSSTDSSTSSSTTNVPPTPAVPPSTNRVIVQTEGEQ